MYYDIILSLSLILHCSAIINFIKFHFNVYLDAGSVQEYNETRVSFAGFITKKKAMVDYCFSLHHLTYTPIGPAEGAVRVTGGRE